MSKFALIIPMYNEERIIEQTLSTLNDFLIQNFPEGDYMIIAADNASTDRTGEIVTGMQTAIQNLRYLFLGIKGKGHAIKSGWDLAGTEQVDIYAFMDADLATDLNALPSMIKEMQTCDICIGDRYHPDSQINRSLNRQLISRAYRLLAQKLLNSRISDFPCGFKAINRSVLNEIVPKVQNSTWFFDSELISLAEKAGKKITHIPVQWADHRDGSEQSRVNIWQVSKQYLTELLRLRKRLKEIK